MHKQAKIRATRSTLQHPKNKHAAAQFSIIFSSNRTKCTFHERTVLPPLKYGKQGLPHSNNGKTLSNAAELSTELRPGIMRRLILHFV